MRLFFSALIAVSLCVAVSSCGPKRNMVVLDYARYEPDLGAALDDYRGRSVYLMNVASDWTDKEWSRYYSPNGRVTYQTNMLKPYFWFMIRRALVNSGLGVSDMENPDLAAPAVRFTFKSLNDQDFLFAVDIFKKDKSLFSRDFKIVGPPLPGEEPAPEELEKRAFAMVTQTVLTVFTDPDFKKAFLEH
ncbi:MAG: hypothetical protein V1816_22900 [Pseudomonadota bacterium]